VDPLLDGFRFQEIQKLLYRQLHEANETLRLSKVRELPKMEQDWAADAARVAFDRWTALVRRREVPDDLKHWDGTGTPPGSRGDASGAWFKMCKLGGCAGPSGWLAGSVHRRPNDNRFARVGIVRWLEKVFCPKVHSWRW